MGSMRMTEMAVQYVLLLSCSFRDSHMHAVQSTVLRRIRKLRRRHASGAFSQQGVSTN